MLEGTERAYWWKCDLEVKWSAIVSVKICSLNTTLQSLFCQTCLSVSDNVQVAVQNKWILEANGTLNILKLSKFLTAPPFFSSHSRRSTLRTTSSGRRWSSPMAPRDASLAAERATRMAISRTRATCVWWSTCRGSASCSPTLPAGSTRTGWATPLSMRTRSGRFPRPRRARVSLRVTCNGLV